MQCNYQLRAWSTWPYVWKTFLSVYLLGFTVVSFSTYCILYLFLVTKLWHALMLIFVWPFDLWNQGKVKLPCEHGNASESACITSQPYKGFFQNQNLKQFNVDHCAHFDFLNQVQIKPALWMQHHLRKCLHCLFYPKLGALRVNTLSIIMKQYLLNFYEN